MAISRQEVQGYTRKLYRFLEKQPNIEFKKMREYRGLIWVAEDCKYSEPVQVHLDHRDRLLSTLIHEFLHFQHPDWSETKVLIKERELINSLSNVQIRNIIKRFAEVL